jgi:hypothetical protein
MADAVGMQKTPVKLLAGINLAARRHIGMGQNVLGQNAVPRDDVPAQCRDRLHLQIGGKSG